MEVFQDTFFFFHLLKPSWLEKTLVMHETLLKIWFLNVYFCIFYLYFVVSGIPRSFLKPAADPVLGAKIDPQGENQRCGSRRISIV